MPQNGSATCPGCDDQPKAGQVPTPDGSLWQTCPTCKGSGKWPGPGSFWAYAIDFALTNQAPTVGTIQIKKGKDFRWKFVIAKRAGSFTYLLDQNGNGYQAVFNQLGQPSAAGLQDVNFWGTGINPFPLPDPIDIGEEARLAITVTDTSGANNAINMFLCGAHFPAGTLVSK